VRGCFARCTRKIKRAPALRADMHFLLRARMLRTLHSQNKNVHPAMYLGRALYIKNKKDYLSGFNKGIS